MRVSSWFRVRPPYSSGSRRSRTSRLTPFRTATRTARLYSRATQSRHGARHRNESVTSARGKGLSAGEARDLSRCQARVRDSVGDQRVESRANLVGWKLDPGDRLARRLEEDKAWLPVARLLVPRQRRPGGVAVDGDGLRRERFLDRARVEPGEPQRSEQAERDRLAVSRAVVAAGGLERVREGVAEVQDLPLAALVRVAQADGGLERGAAANELCVRQLPERLAGEQPGLHHLGHPRPALLRREGLEQRGVDQRPLGPVEGAR